MKVSTRIPYPQVFLNELDIVKEYGYRLEIEFMWRILVLKKNDLYSKLWQPWRLKESELRTFYKLNGFELVRKYAYLVSKDFNVWNKMNNGFIQTMKVVFILRTLNLDIMMQGNIDLQTKNSKSCNFTKARD